MSRGAGDEGGGCSASGSTAVLGSLLGLLLALARRRR
ncbi:MYXO-CTERM sorting domain-containing protein [Pyxidicoccus sp. 3LFB2]